MSANSTDIAYEYIRKRIMNGEYAPGMGLTTEFLSAKIGVSRTPIRDALRMLELDGLITIRARSGASVKQLNPREFKALYELRLALESYAAGLAAVNWNDRSLAEIRTPFEEMQKITKRMMADGKKESSLTNDVVQQDTYFHIAILAAADNELIKKEILRLNIIKRAQLLSQSFVFKQNRNNYWSKERWAGALASHEKIFTAIVARDVPAARLAMEEHLKVLLADLQKEIFAADVAAGEGRRLSPEELAYS